MAIFAFVAESRALAADEPAGKTEGLVPCLAIAADGSPVCPGTTFAPSKRLTAAFQLKPDQSAKSLHSRWISLDGSENLIAENTLELKGQRAGWLRLELQQPAKPGKYRLDASLDGKPWKSIDLEITEPPHEAKAEKPADLMPLKEQTSFTYDLVVRSYGGTTVEIPGVKPDPDGASRATLVLNIGKKDDAGYHYAGSVNGAPGGEMWVKLDEKGIVAVRRKSGEEVKDINPPELVHALPPKLDEGTQWTDTGKDDAQLELRLLGPVLIEGPQGPQATYLVFSEEQVAIGSPGTSAARGKKTVERYYAPNLGLVREVHVETIGGKPSSRQEISLAGRKYKLVANPTMKGRLGRVQFAYPPDTKHSEARVSVYKAGSKPDDKPISTGYGDKSFDMMPGKYDLSINGKRVPVEVKSGHDTIPYCGVLRVHAGSDTRFRVLDADSKTELFTAYGEHDVPLPAGSYVLEISGATEPIKVEDGKVMEF